MSSAAEISNRFINELLIDIHSLDINTLKIAKTSDHIETAIKLIEVFSVRNVLTLLMAMYT